MKKVMFLLWMAIFCFTPVLLAAEKPARSEEGRYQIEALNAKVEDLRNELEGFRDLRPTLEDLRRRIDDLQDRVDYLTNKS